MDKVVLDLSAIVAISADATERSLRRLLSWPVELYAVSSEFEHLHNALTELSFDHERIMDEKNHWLKRVHLQEPLAAGTVMTADPATDAAPALASELSALGLISADSDRLQFSEFTDPNDLTIGIYPPPLTGEENYPWERESELQTVVLDKNSIRRIMDLPEAIDLLDYSKLNPSIELIVATEDLEEFRTERLAAGTAEAPLDGFLIALEAASTVMDASAEKAYFEDTKRDRAVALARSVHADALLTEDPDLIKMAHWEGISFFPPVTSRESNWVDGKTVILPTWFDLLVRARDREDETMMIYRAVDELTANLAAQILEENGIDCLISPQQIAWFDGIMKVATGYWGDVRVLSHDVWRARELLDEKMPREELSEPEQEA